MPDLSGTTIGRYHVLEPLGEGGMASVYRAYDTHLDCDVAIKVIRREAFSPDVLERILKRFEREARVLARLTHPNIVPVTDYGEHDGAPFLVMRYMPGGTLKQRMGGRPMRAAEAARVLAPVAGALEYAHQNNILHRDVKPSNILITETGAPVLTDFGIARLLETQEGKHTLTGTGVGIGTPEYMAPEQGLGKAVDARADVYALGIVLYEMITGRRPFEGDTPMAVIFQHMTEPLPRPRQFNPEISEEAEKILLKALAKKPEDRYQSMREFGDVLERLVAAHMVGAASARGAAGQGAEKGKAGGRLSGLIPGLGRDRTPTPGKPVTPPSAAGAPVGKEKTPAPAAPKEKTPPAVEKTPPGMKTPTPAAVLPEAVSQSDVTPTLDTAPPRGGSAAFSETDVVAGGIDAGAQAAPGAGTLPAVQAPQAAPTMGRRLPAGAWMGLAGVAVVVVATAVLMLSGLPAKMGLFAPPASPAETAVAGQNTRQVTRAFDPAEVGSWQTATASAYTATALAKAPTQTLSPAQAAKVTQAAETLKAMYGTSTAAAGMPANNPTAQDTVTAQDTATAQATATADATQAMLATNFAATVEQMAATQKAGQYTATVYAHETRWAKQYTATARATAGTPTPSARQMALATQAQATLDQMAAQRAIQMTATALAVDATATRSAELVGTPTPTLDPRAINAANLGTLVETGAYDLNQTVDALALAPDGKTFALAVGTKILFYDSATGKLVDDLPSGLALRDMAFSPDGRFIAGAPDDTSLRIWNIQDGILYRVVYLKQKPTCVRYAPNGKRLAACYGDKLITLIDIDKGIVEQQLSGHSDVVRDIAFSPDGRYLVSGSDDRSVIVWDLLPFSSFWRTSSSADVVLAVAYAPDGKRVASAYPNDTARVYRAMEGNRTALFQAPAGDGVWRIAFSADGAGLFSLGLSGNLRAYTLDPAQETAVYTPWSGAVGNAWLALSGDGMRLLAASRDGRVVVYGVRAQR